MIGVDTNILVRAVLDDTPRQSSLAKKILSNETQNKNLFISSYAILEMVWVLKVNKVERKIICEAVFDLLDSPGITIGQREVVVAAIERYSRGKADFGDHLILAEGEFNGAPKIATFDKIFGKESDRCFHPK